MSVKSITGISMLVLLFVCGVFLSHQKAFKGEKDDLLENSVIPLNDNGLLTKEFGEELKTILKEVRIVSLGEATHEDGLTFEHKTKLVKYLHEELGFNVIAFEFGFYGNWNTNENLKKGMSVKEAAKHAGWSKSKYSYPIYEYIASTKKTNTPLNYAGFDAEKVPDGIPNIKAFLDTIIRVSNYKITEPDRLLVDSLIEALYARLGSPIKKNFKYKRHRKGRSVIKDLKEHIAKNKDALVTHWNEETYLMYDLTLSSIEMDQKEELAGEAWNSVRDHNMAKRVKWLTDSIYKNEKIILWGASSHFARNMISIDRSKERSNYDWDPFYQMGDWLHEYYGDSFYAISFVVASGKVGTVFPENHKYKKYESIREVDNKEPNSFEGVAYATEKQTLFCDLRDVTEGSWLNGEFVSYPFGYNKDKTQWKRVHDGLFFMREMKPDVFEVK